MSNSGSPATVKLDDGVFVERDVLNIVEKIREYDPNLRVQYLDPQKFEDITDAPYRIVEVCPDGEVRPVFSVWTLDETVLEKIYLADNQKHDILAAIDGKNLLVKKDKERRYQEERDEAKDIIVHVLKSPKGKYSFKNPMGKMVVIDDSLKRLPPDTDGD